MLRSLVIAAALVMSVPALADDRTVSVSGLGQVEVAPDMATVTLGAQAEAKTAQAALAESSKAVAAAMAVLQDAGVEERDIQTSGLNLSPRWERHDSTRTSPPKIVGYIASNTVTVRVRDLDALGGILDAVVQSGANRLNGVSFGLAEPREAEDAARRAAVADARAKAGLYADAAGIALGDVQTIAEDGGAGGPMPMMRMEAAMSDAAVPMAPGELTVSARVRMVFDIAD